MSEDHIWDIIEDYTKRVGLISHQLTAFNYFLSHGINEIVTSDEWRINDSYAISFSNVYIPKPYVIEEDRRVTKLLPNKARNRDLTYESPVYVTVTESVDDKINIFHRVELCRLPIMLNSSHCHLHDMPPHEKVKASECEYTHSGYFIIRGHERVLVAQLRASYNKPLVFDQQNDKFELICEVRSMSDITCHSVVVKTMIGHDDRTIHVAIPYMKDTIPVGVLFKALGFNTVEEFSGFIGLKNPLVDKYIRFILRDSFCNDVNYAMQFFINETSQTIEEWDALSEPEKRVWEKKCSTNGALKYIAKTSINPVKPSDYVKFGLQIVQIELFPHMSITSSNHDRALFLGYMLRKLFATKLGLRQKDDRDNYTNKRVESSGILCQELFKQLFKKFKESLLNSFDKTKTSNIEILHLITRNTIISSGFRHCFSTGNWGVPKTSYIRAGVSQVLSRLSFGATLSHLRRVSIPIGKEAKNAKIRQINPSQIFFICPCETPEGQPVGIVMNLSFMTIISEKTAPYIVLKYLEKSDLIDHTSKEATKVFLNGAMFGFTRRSDDLLNKLKNCRSSGAIAFDVSFGYDDIDDEINIATDAGRLLRPVFAVENGKLKITKKDGTNWDELVDKGLVQYVDNSEISNSVVAFNEGELGKYHCDFCEISPSMMLGVMASIIPFPDHSQSPRNCYQTSMGKQAMSMYSLAFQKRTDTIAHVIGYPQRPLVSTRASALMGFDEMASGVNVVCAIACYTGFNQEDSQVINHSAIQRGLFLATTYRTHSEQENKHSGSTFERIGCPPLDKRKLDVNYSLLGPDGIVMKRFPNGKQVSVKKGDVLIGKIFIDSSKGVGNEIITDCSFVVKKEDEGYIDRIVNSITPDGYKLVKVVIRSERIPEIGDKFASRAAQKGTCGMVYREEDMPWTAEGIRPDIIINPHCIPSRMTINQLMESVLGKSCALEGTFGDATPFCENSATVANEICDRLEMNKFNGCGTEILYNGFTGEPMGEVFIGLVYYQRLKHLVSDKIHARATGPVTTLTRQPLEGRSRDGGLRFGEMERDCMISHGTSMFLKERLCDQSDPYQAPICDKCGNISTTRTYCNICDCDSISMVGMPYVSKLVLQELNCMCIKTLIKSN